MESIATEGEDFDSIEADLTSAPVEENVVDEEIPEVTMRVMRMEICSNLGDN